MRLRRLLFFGAGALAAAGLNTLPALGLELCDGTPYVVGNRPADFFAVASDPAALVDAGDLVLDGERIALNAVAIRSTDGLMYGWDDTNQQLVTVDSGLTVTPLPTPALPTGPREPVYLAGEISADGDAYYLLTRLSNDTLYVVDLTLSPASLSFVTVALSEPVRVSDIALNPEDGLLYGTEVGELVRVDPVSGDVVRSGLDFGGVPPDQLGSVWFDLDGDLFGVHNDNGSGESELWRIDVETLTATRLGVSGAALANSDGAICFADGDGDGVDDGVDLCPDSEVPEAITRAAGFRLGVNRFALVDGDGIFDTRSPPGRGPRRSYTTEDTAGCSCEQIIELLELGRGHRKLGCSISAMDDWVALVPFLP